MPSICSNGGLGICRFNWCKGWHLCCVNNRLENEIYRNISSMTYKCISHYRKSKTPEENSHAGSAAVSRQAQV